MDIEWSVQHTMEMQLNHQDQARGDYTYPQSKLNEAKHIRWAI